MQLRSRKTTTSYSVSDNNIASISNSTISDNNDSNPGIVDMLRSCRASVCCICLEDSAEVVNACCGSNTHLVCQYRWYQHQQQLLTGTYLTGYGEPTNANSNSNSNSCPVCRPTTHPAANPGYDFYDVDDGSHDNSNEYEGESEALQQSFASLEADRHLISLSVSPYRCCCGKQ